MRWTLLCGLLLSLLLASRYAGASANGYYRHPAIHGDSLIFVAEGDLWRVPLQGGSAMRLTSHAGEESHPAISPDGKTVAFTASYEGPTEVYTMPLSGGLPTRRTFDGGHVSVAGWTPSGEMLVATDVYSTLPSIQLITIDLTTSKQTRIPLAEAANGSFDSSGQTLFFTRMAFQGSHTKRYRGGTVQNIWRFSPGDPEATLITADHPGTSNEPMWYGGRVYFIADRDGTMNLWSMSPEGKNLQQHTRHDGWDVASPSMHQGRIVYQLGADLRLYDLHQNKDEPIPITLHTDLDQMREKTVKKPMEYISSVHLSPDGDRVAITARGQVFVAPHRQGRLVEATRRPGVRYRGARFIDDASLVALSDESGEVELWKLPASGVGESQQLTRDATVLRSQAVPSPDGRYVAHHDKDQRLFIYDLQKKQDRKIDESKLDEFMQLRWSPDSRWIAYVAMTENQFAQIRLCEIETGEVTPLTTDRYDSFSPAWSPDGKWLYFLSDRNLKSIVESPWGSYQPEPFLDKRTQVYLIPLAKLTTRSPFAEKNELVRQPKEPDDEPASPISIISRILTTQPTTKPHVRSKAPLRIDLDNIQQRLIKAPIPPGNYEDLSVNEKSLFMTSRPAGERKDALIGLNIGPENREPKTITDDVSSYELARDGKKMLIRKRESIYIIDAAAQAADLSKKDVDLSDWLLTVIPREEWRQMFDEAWRLERDYFYDRGMHGVDWKALRDKYRPLVDRVTTRAELSDLIAQMVSELSALHIFVRGGDLRTGDENLEPSSLGALLVRDEDAGGYRVEHIYESDPDEPDRASPLRRLDVNMSAGDIIEAVNGTPTLSVSDVGLLLRRRANQQVLLRVRSTSAPSAATRPATASSDTVSSRSTTRPAPASAASTRDVIVFPLSPSSAADLRYHAWQYTRRKTVDHKGDKQIGYVHLRAMSGANYTEWAKNYYPAFNRQGLIIDVRHNKGGNIDSWIIARLLRKPWFYWSQRIGQQPRWNMQYAFRGHIVVLCDQWTASDGEAFTEGVKRLKLGTVIGTRTWGGEIWLSANNFLVDKGIATAAEYGVFGPEGQWLIEGHGVEPDITVDNLPHATFKGLDAQLEAAIVHLQKLIKEKPVPPIEAPPHPNKAFRRETASGNEPSQPAPASTNQ